MLPASSCMPLLFNCEGEVTSSVYESPTRAAPRWLELLWCWPSGKSWKPSHPCPEFWV